MERKKQFFLGMKSGIPVCLGYLAVSFAFGMLAKKAGLTAFQAVLMSITNVTSAGQFAGLTLIGASATYVEMALTQMVLNIRYCLMSCSLSQKIDPKASRYHRYFVAYGVTDEIFAISVCRQGRVSPFFSYGLIFVSVSGWVGGTFMGVISGEILPDSVISALGIAIYGMFIAIIMQPAVHNRVIAGVVLLAMMASLLFEVLPLLNRVSSGFRIILITIIISAVAAWKYPVKEVEVEHEG